MKIKTITCHDVYNVGASLQAYALVTYLCSLGHDTEIIDYKPEYLIHYKLTGIGNPIYDKPIFRELYILAKLPGRLKSRFSRRKREYDVFTKKYLPITKIRYTSNKELKDNPPEADIYFAGSDQIWNTIFNNGKDPAFYLDFAPLGTIRASYAASFATEDIDEEWKFQVKKWLTALDYISVRESSGVEIANNLDIDNVVQVLDPVFLLNVAQWQKIEKNLDISEPYILLYDFDCSKEISEYTKKIAERYGWKIYSILPNDCCHRCFSQEGPNAFLWLIHHAEFVISNSFHATAFSLIFQKQFVVFKRHESINTRMQDLISCVNLENRLIVNQSNIDLEEINYLTVNAILKEKIDESKAYIDYVLSGVKNEKENSICD